MSRTGRAVGRMRQQLGHPVLLPEPASHPPTPCLALGLGPGLPGATAGKGGWSQGCLTGTAGLAGPGILAEESPGDR